MRFRTSLVLISAFAAATLGGAPVRADDDPLSYSDPGMHFEAPAGWERLGVGGSADPNSQDPSAVAAWALNRGKPDQRIILIAVAPFDGPLEEFETSSESELRKASDGTFIDKHERATLSNGMPAFWVRVSQGTEAGHYMRRYEYVVIDTQRGITVSYVGRQGDFDEKEAKAALASLYVVVYPRKRS